jgi:predicted nucleic acid-binding protein
VRYWDSSALVPLVVQEAETEQRERLQRLDGHVTTWWGSWVECASALNRLHRDGDLDDAGLNQALGKLSRAAAGWLRIRPSERVRQRALRLLRIHPLRAADALQLAAALAASGDAPETLMMVCSARRLSEAAVKEGFEVL